jgi:hypothetical protein
MSYTAPAEEMVQQQAALAAQLEALARTAEAHTALLVAVLVLVVVVLLLVAALALLGWQWGARALADHAALMQQARQPTPEALGLSNAVGDLDDAARLIGEAAQMISAVRDELRGLRALAEAWLATQGVESVVVGHD